MNCSGDIASEQYYPDLGCFEKFSDTNVQRACKMNSSVASLPPSHGILGVEAVLGSSMAVHKFVCRLYNCVELS